MKVFITGSNLYDHDQLKWETVETDYGKVEWLRGKISNNHEEIVILPRHGKNHKKLPNAIHYLANFSAIKTLNPECVVSFSVCGILNKNIPLRMPFVPDDFFFPENRLPNGSICTVFQNPEKSVCSDFVQKKGHLLPVENYFNPAVQSDLAESCVEQDLKVLSGTYVHANGPRFNSKSEISFFQAVGGDAISQTCGPEIVMSNELEIPFGMLCVGIDYANGVSDVPTSPEELGGNLAGATDVFLRTIDSISSLLDKGASEKNKKYHFGNFLFEV